MASSNQKYAVVTGANRGIGLATVKLLASRGVKVILTSRDEAKGLQALASLRASGIPEENLAYHQLDVRDQRSVDRLVRFLEGGYGRLDILVNNAAVLGAAVDPGSFRGEVSGLTQPLINWRGVRMIDSVESANECFETNYYGPKWLKKRLRPLLRNSEHPRVVNVSASTARLAYLPTASRESLSVDNLTVHMIEDVLNQYLLRLSHGCREVREPHFPAFKYSKAALNGLTRVWARKYPQIIVNSVCPGFTRTDMTFHAEPVGSLSAEESAESVVRLALLPDGGPTGRFFIRDVMAEF